MLLIIAALFIAISIFILWRIFHRPEKIKITIPGVRTIFAEPDNSLLFALSKEKIFLPTACSGGTCAQCKCIVESGGGRLLSAERRLLSPEEQIQHVRLACQVKVMNDMIIRL